MGSKMYQAHENMEIALGHNDLDDCSPCDAEHSNSLYAETEGMDVCVYCNCDVTESDITSVPGVIYTDSGSEFAVAKVGIGCVCAEGTCPQGKWSDNSAGTGIGDFITT